MRYELCRAIADVLIADVVPDGLSSRAQGLLADLRDQYGWLEQGKSTFILDTEGNATWWNFAGKLLNSAFKDALGDQADKVVAYNECLEFRRIYSDRDLIHAVRSLLASEEHALEVPLDEAFVKELKFSECLSPEEIERELGARYSVQCDYANFCSVPVVVLREPG